jgi:hypothetical protein
MSIILKKRVLFFPITVVLLLSVTTIIIILSSNTDRGSLPFYPIGSPIGMQKQIGPLEKEYERANGAAIIKIVGTPKYYEDDILLKPGSPEEQLFLKSGAALAPKNKYYLMEAKVIKIIDDRKLPSNTLDKITISSKWIYAENDPVYQYSQVNQDQEYLLFFIYDAEKDVYYYTIRAAFFVKNGRVFSTNEAESINMYSGKTTIEIAEVLKNINIK